MLAPLLHELFPEGISDEAAYSLVYFFENLTIELESCYCGQMRRYLDSQRIDPATMYPRNDDDSMPF